MFARTLIVISLLASSAFGQTVAERFAGVRAAMERGDSAAAIEELSAIRSNDPGASAANELDYLLARLYERSGDTASAGALYSEVRSRGSVLKAYATWHLADMARHSGNVFAERLLLREIEIGSPGSLLSSAVKKRLARSYFESKNYDLTTAILTSGAVVDGQKPTDREDKLLLGRAYLYQNQPDQARAIFNELIATSANAEQPDDNALGAVRGLDLLDVGTEKYGKEAPKLLDPEHLKRAKIYQFNRSFFDARLHLMTIVNDHPTSSLVPESLYLIGRGFAQTTNFTDAVKWFERIEEQFPNDQFAKDAILQMASGYTRLGKHREAVARYEKFIAKYPNDEKIDRAYLNIIDVLRDAGEETEAKSRADDAAARFRGKAGEAQAVFVRARIRMARNEWDATLGDLDHLRTLNDLGGAGVPGGTTIAEVSFLRAFVLEQLRRFPEATQQYLSISDGRGEYYGWLASRRLQALAADKDAKESVERELAQLRAVSGGDRIATLSKIVRLTEGHARTTALNELRAAYAAAPQYKVPVLPKLRPVGRTQFRSSPPPDQKADSKTIVDELAFLGLFDEAAVEYEAANRGTTASPKAVATDIEFTIAHTYLQGERADRMAAYIEPLVKMPADFQPELMPHDISRYLFPNVYRAELQKYAAPRKVDPRFLLSIMRQESRFRPNVKSYAAARGLMQFISDTSDRIAAKLDLPDFEQDDLYHPSTAILFGSEYTGELFGHFINQPEAVAASYNGGEDNMKRWLGRSRSDLPERYVPEIAYSQSKDYVWKVMSNYRMYQLFYDENLSLR